MDKNKYEKGFTIIELIITLLIIGIFIVISLPAYNTFTAQQKLRNETRKLASIIDLAKKKSFSSDLYNPNCTDFNGYRVSITANNYSLNFGCSGSFQTLQTYALANNISITQGTGNLTFPALGLGISITINTITLKSTTINRCQSISISAIGTVDISDSQISC
jgi:prepilin-type N-terminal cleavage/methylation domain-containing protein